MWKIIVGGNKLSRGYTIEGLTVSYYRRVAGTADTLMQMGRWFGFRPGYQDLVRVFLGVAEGRDGKTDLVSLFNGLALHGGICPYGGTFLIFSDYMRPAIRLAALMHLPVMFVFTHDSIGPRGWSHASAD